MNTWQTKLASHLEPDFVQKLIIGVIATFTILNLFLGIIVSTMPELAMLPDPHERSGGESPGSL